MSAALYSNGPLVNSPGTGVGGADESILESVGTNNYGYGVQLTGTSDNRIADDFTVPSGETWDVTEIVTYGYQSFAGATSTFTAATLRIWDGDPSDPGSSVVYGDVTTNVLSSTSWTGAYRTGEAGSGCPSGSCADRAIMANVLTAPVSLSEGTYWIDFQFEGSAASGPWAPPVPTFGSCPTGNALQSVGGSWAAVVNGSCPVGDAFPFEVVGTTSTAGVTIDYIGSTEDPQRDDFVFIRALATNSSASTIRTRVYFTVDYPDGTDRTYSVLSSDFPGNSSFQVQKIKRMKFPLAADAPAGTYTVTIYAADDIANGGTIYDSDTFTFDLGPGHTVKTGDLASGVDAGPNPFTSETTIRYELAEAAEVDLRVFDVTGREVASLASGTQSAGAHSALFAAGDLPGGVYVWRLAVGGEVTTGRVTLAR